MKASSVSNFALAVLTCSMMGVPVLAQSTAAPQAAPSYKLSVFAKAPAGLSAPDSVAVLDNHVFVGYGDGHLPDGSDGLNSQVVEYDMEGRVQHTYTVPGHNDGIKIDPFTHQVWALQNEDANANLVIIDPKKQDQKLYTFGPTLHGGGYDDIVFLGCKVFVSASNPAHNPNRGPAIVSITLHGNTVDVEPVLSGSAKAIDLVTGATVELNLQDPDSMTLDPLGNIVLDSQADQELVIVGNAGTPQQTVSRLPLSFLMNGTQTPVETDDTTFVTSTQGFILFADKGLNTVYKVSKNAFAPGAAYTAADGGPFVGALDLTSGIITPVVTGLKGPGGMTFVDTSKHLLDPDFATESHAACSASGRNPF